MKVLFLHQNFPAQFKHIAPALRARGDEVRALYYEGRGLRGIPSARYRIREGSSPTSHPWAKDFDTKMRRAEACWEAMRELAAQGFSPDLVIAHPGWGEAHGVNDVFPDARQLHFVEWYYTAQGADVNFDPEFPSDAGNAGRVRAKNSVNLLSLMQMDAGYSPTDWQRAQVPERFRDQLSVIHDGVDTSTLKPNHQRTIHFNRDNVTLGQNDELVTFINRNLEPMRGWHVFARCLPRLLAERPNAHVAIIGGDDRTSYGPMPDGGGTWRQRIWSEVQDRVDMQRVHFLGRVPYGAFQHVIQASSCHVYLTVPSVLSWSMLEAMAMEALVVGSDTPPVREVIEDGVNGLLTPFLDADALADRVAAVLAEPDRYRDVRQAARQTIVERYDLKSICLPAQLELVDRVAGMRHGDVDT